MKNNAENEVIGLIQRGQFSEAKQQFVLLDDEQQKEVIFGLGMDEDNICAYTFTTSLLIDHRDDLELHSWASTFMIHCFPYVDGSDETALYHIRRAIELRPDDIEWQGMLLFIHRMPLIEKLVSRDEVRLVAESILQRDPKNSAAKYSLESLAYEEEHYPQDPTKKKNLKELSPLARMRELILIGEFLEAYKDLHEITQEELRALLFEIGGNDESLCAYIFVWCLLLKQETAEFHALAAQIIFQNFPYSAEIKGFYATALYHARRALELKPGDVELQVNLLVLQNLPEKLVSDEEAQKIAASVLEKDPNNKGR